MIQENIANFSLVFNHYPTILKLKDQNKPVLAYYFQENYFRIDLAVKKEQNWIVRGIIKDKFYFYKIYSTFEEAYSYVKESIHKNKIRSLF